MRLTGERAADSEPGKAMVFEGIAEIIANLLGPGDSSFRLHPAKKPSPWHGLRALKQRPCSLFYAPPVCSGARCSKV